MNDLLSLVMLVCQEEFETFWVFDKIVRRSIYASAQNFSDAIFDNIVSAFLQITKFLQILFHNLKHILC